MPLWAPVLMASNKTNNIFGGVGSPTALYLKYDMKTKSLPAFYSMAVIGGEAPGHNGGLLLREGTPDEIALEEPFDAGSIGDADIKYSFPYFQTNSTEDPGSGEKGGVLLRWVECLDGALVLFRLGLLVFAVCSEQERSGPNKCFAMWARQNRSYRNKWRSAIWARRNSSYRNKWFQLALLVLLVPRVSAMTTTTPPDGDGSENRRDEAGTHQAETGPQMPPLAPLCADDVDSGAFNAGGAPLPCSYFSAQPSACPSYSIARATCPVACDTCSPLLPWLSHTRPPPSPPPFKSTPTLSLYPQSSGRTRPRSSSLPRSPPLLLLSLPTPPPPIWVPSPPLLALPCTVLPCTEASNGPGLYRGLQLAVPGELQTQVSTSVGLLSALADTSVSHIVLAPGTYILSTELNVTRSVVLEGAVAGSVVLDAQASSSSLRRVLVINAGSLGVVHLIGLNITGGSTAYDRLGSNLVPQGYVLRASHACEMPSAPIGNSRLALCLQGGGVYVLSGTVTITFSSIYGNTAYNVRARVQKFASHDVGTLLTRFFDSGLRNCDRRFVQLQGVHTAETLKVPIALMGDSRLVCCLQGGGVYVDSGTVTITSSSIQGNFVSRFVRTHLQQFPSP